MEIKEYNELSDIPEKIHSTLLSFFKEMDKREQGYWRNWLEQDTLVAELNAKTLEERWEGGWRFAVAFSEDLPVGFVEFTQTVEDSGVNWMSIHYLYVKDDQRGKGYGRGLVDFVKKTAKEENVASVTLSVNVLNTEALKFYSKIGFIEHIRYLGIAP